MLTEQLKPVSHAHALTRNWPATVVDSPMRFSVYSVCYYCWKGSVGSLFNILQNIDDKPRMNI